MKIALVIFTKNELENLKLIFPKIPIKLVDKVYAIDGNSTDGTREFFKKKNIKMFGQEYKGIGGAYESAFRNVKTEGIVFFHPDGNMDPKDIKTFINLLKDGHGFVIGTRMIKGAFNEEDIHFFKPRKWFNIGLALVTHIMLGKDGNKSSDVVQGYRAFNRKAYLKLGIDRPDPVGPEFEQVIKALKKGIKITEFPTREGLRIHGDTTMPSLKTGWGNIKVFLRELLPA